MKHNFNAGPCILPKPAIESTIEAIRNFDGTGIGLLEISHRTPGWERIMAETEQLWRDLLNIPDNYAVMFLGGGASTQFYTVAANFLNKKLLTLKQVFGLKKLLKRLNCTARLRLLLHRPTKTTLTFQKDTKSQLMRITSTSPQITPFTEPRLKLIWIALST